MCAGSPAGQPCPGLHQEQRGHRAREGILPLCPALLRPPGSPASSSGALSTGQTWSCWNGARGGPSNDPRAGTPLLGGKAGRAGAVQPGEGSGETSEQLPVPGGELEESWRGTFYKGMW